MKFIMGSPLAAVGPGQSPPLPPPLNPALHMNVQSKLFICTGAFAGAVQARTWASRSTASAHL